MVVDEWTQLVQYVDKLINQLKAERQETQKWKARAIELEGLQNNPDRITVLESQTKDRELERYRKDRKKVIAMVSGLISELDQAEQRARENQHE